MARTYKDLTDHAVDRVTGGAEEDYARGHARVPGLRRHAGRLPD